MNEKKTDILASIIQHLCLVFKIFCINNQNVLFIQRANEFQFFEVFEIISQLAVDKFSQLIEYCYNVYSVLVINQCDKLFFN